MMDNGSILDHRYWNQIVVSDRTAFKRRFPMLALEATERALRDVVNAIESGDDGLFTALEIIPAPLYVTDASGTITYYNPACVGFAGRTPALGKDQWCVTWKLYADDGSFLPHSECPMAVTLRTKQPVRGMTAIAERPDGTRVNFMPFPTPLFGPTGEFVGAVNILIDVTEFRQIADLQAERCRRLANSIGDLATVDVLRRMADDYEGKAIVLETAASANEQHFCASPSVSNS